MCRSLNKPCNFSKPGSQYDRAVVGWTLATHLGSFSATSESSTAAGFSPLRMGVDSQERCVASHAFGLTSLWGNYWYHVRFWTNLTQMNWFRREKIFILKWKLVIFENEPLSKHWRIAWTYLSKTFTLFKEMMQNWLIRNKVEIYFSFLSSDFHNCPEKWLMGFFCSWVYYEAYTAIRSM